MPTAIEFDNIGKQYRLGLVSTQTLSHDLHRWWTTNILRKEDPYLKIGETNDRTVKGESDYVWALRDINFKVEQGDVVGIIGRNGAGKSTLLKLLSRVTAPTTGQIRSRGRIGSLLEVGTGFHPEMTGRENIFMNGAIMGMTRHEIARKLDDIVDFSGCSRYLDTPVKRYSSGMTVRLGFAVAAFLEPEILVVDEVLAVGDAEFQKKAIGKMKDVSQGEGRTVLFVSHNMASIKQLCHSGLLLENGIIKTAGDIGHVIDSYLTQSGTSSKLCFEDLNTAPGNDVIRIKSFEINASNGASQIDIQTGITFRIVFFCLKEGAMLDLNYMVKTMDDVVVFWAGKDIGEIGEKDSKIGYYTVTFKLDPHTINAGKYKIIVWFGENRKYTVFEGFEHFFNVEENLYDKGLELSSSPGTLRPRLNFVTTFDESLAK